MRFELRLLKAAEPETYSSEEVEGLRSCLSSAPWIEEVTELARHPKGGYAAVVQLREGLYEPLIECLWVAGYRLAI